MNRKRLILANAIQSVGTYVFVAGLITFFVSFFTPIISCLITAMGAVMHIGAMLWGIKMDDGGRMSRQYIEK